MTKSFFEFRLDKIKILDNREWFECLGGAEVKFYSFLTTSNDDFSNTDELLHTTDHEAKKEIIKNAAKNILSAKEFHETQNVHDGHIFYFGDTGVSLYRAEKIPVFFDWLLIGVELDRDINELGREIDLVLEKPKLDSFIENTIILAGSAVNPAVVAGIEIGKFILRTISQEMLKNKDDQIGVLHQSFNCYQHYPQGLRKRKNVPDQTGNMFIDYTIFGKE